MYMCAKCKVYACSAGEKKALPKNCPMRNEPLLKEALSEYEKPENHDFYVTSSEIESLSKGNHRILQTHGIPEAWPGVLQGPPEGGGDRVGYSDEAWIYGGIRDLQGWRDR